MRSRPDCTRCASYFITHDPERPYGCRAFAMKSAVRPSFEVFRSSGRDCEAFEERAPRGDARDRPSPRP